MVVVERRMYQGDSPFEGKAGLHRPPVVLSGAVLTAMLRAMAPSFRAALSDAPEAASERVRAVISTMAACTRVCACWKLVQWMYHEATRQIHTSITCAHVLWAFPTPWPPRTFGLVRRASACITSGTRFRVEGVSNPQNFPACGGRGGG